MSITGCSLWNDREKAFYEQTNNPTEHLLKCLLPPGISALETCGPTAALNCQASMGSPVEFITPGGYCPQPEEVLNDWFNDPNNFARMSALWSGLDPEQLPGNEVVDWYPLAVKEVFGNESTVVEDLDTTSAITLLQKGQAIQICLKQPRHFVALVAFDNEKQVFILKDSWGARWPDGDGFCKTMTLKEFQNNVRAKAIVYY